MIRVPFYLFYDQLKYPSISLIRTESIDASFGAIINWMKEMSSISTQAFPLSCDHGEQARVAHKWMSPVLIVNANGTINQNRRE